MCRLHADDHTLLLQQLRQLASDLDPRLAEQQDPAVAVYSALAAMPRPWLLILDNVPDYESGRQWLPPKGRGHVIVTTRDGSWPRAITVGTLAPDVAAAYLIEVSGQSDEQAAAAIAELVGALPLALAQAASYLRTTGATLDRYLALLRERRQEMLQKPAPADHKDSVALTWSVAMAQLGARVPTALVLLRACAFLAPDDIPHQLLFSSKIQPALPRKWWLPLAGSRRQRGAVHEGRLPPLLPRADAEALVQLCADPVMLDEAIAALRTYSFISVSVQATISVHRLVQDVTRDELPDKVQKSWSDAVAVLLRAAVPDDGRERESWAACAALLPHARTSLGPLSTTVWLLADNYLRYAGQYLTALEVWTDIAKAHVRHSRYGPDHPDSLTARANVAHWTGATGRSQTARDQFAELLPVVERVLGPRHHSTLSVRGSLARWTGEAGDSIAARDQFAELLPIVEQVFRKHPFTLSVRANHARWLGEAGDLQGACERYAALLHVAERVLGAEHRDTLAVRANLAYWTGVMGDPFTARDRYAELLPVLERVVTAEHRETLAVRANLAHWTGITGYTFTARDRYAELLPVVERVLGPEHPDTLADRANLAYWTGATGDSKGAYERYTALLPILQRVLGGGHPQTWAVRANLAWWTDSHLE